MSRSDSRLSRPSDVEADIGFRFLCGCGERFNRDGENWVRPLLPAVGGPFPLRDRLMKAVPLYLDEKMALFSTIGNPELGPENLMHFGLGVFYKPAGHSWRGDSSEPQMLLAAGDVEPLLRQSCSAEERGSLRYRRFSPCAVAIDE